jgi:HEAT repeat protein
VGWDDRVLRRVEFGTDDEAQVDVQMLLSALGERGTSKSRVAAKWLGELGEEEAVPHLIAALRAGDPHLRVTAARSLGSVGNVDAIPSLLEVARKDKLDWVRSWAVASVGEIGDPSVVDQIVAFLQDGDHRVRAGAVWALRKLGDPAALPAVLDARRRDRRSWRYWWGMRGNYRKTMRALSQASRA